MTRNRGRKRAKESSPLSESIASKEESYVKKNLGDVSEKIQQLREKEGENPLIDILFAMVGIINTQQNMLLRSLDSVDRLCEKINDLMLHKIESSASLPAVQVQSSAEEMERRRSVVVSGIPESKAATASQRVAEDAKTVVKLLDDLEVEASTSSIYRLGAADALHGKPRLLKIVFSASAQQKLLLQEARGLKNKKNWERVYIRPSLTPEQRTNEKKLWMELKKARADKPTSYIVIRGGPPGHPNRKIVTLPSRPKN